MANKPMEATTTKRQRRKQGPNPANTWQQQPKIKSPAARERAYLLDAGLGGGGAPKSKEKSKSKDDKCTATTSTTSILDPELNIHSPEIIFGKLLGGTNQRTRHRAVAQLSSYLRARCSMSNVSGGISELDLMKLWKGLWYTLFMADKVPVQDELARRLAGLVWCFAGTEEEDEYAGQVYLDMDEEEQEEEQEEGGEVQGEDEVHDDDDDHDVDDALQKHCRGAHLASLYVRTFLRTMRREWGNIDRHRVDKFYTAVRFMLAEVYRYMAKRHWNLGIIRLFNDTIFEEALSQTPNGLRYHLIDIALDELAKVNAESSLPLTEATFLDCLEPYFALAQNARDRSVQGRVMDKVLGRFLTEYSIVSDGAVEEEEEKEEEEEEANDDVIIFRQVHVGSVAKFIFEVASDGDTDDRHRASLYDMHKAYVRRVKAVGRDVNLDDDDGDGDDNGENDGQQGGEDEEEDADFGQRRRHESDSDFEHNDDDEPRLQEVQEEEGEEDGDDEPATKAKDAKTTKKNKKKKEKRKEAKQAKDEHGDDEPGTKVSAGGGGDGNEESMPLSTPKRKKKKKDKKKKEKCKGDKAGEDVIHISLQEQKRAAEAKGARLSKSMKRPPVDPHAMIDSDGVHSDADMEKAKKKTKTNRNKNVSSKKSRIETEEETEERRVSFGRVNHSKSYKASMKALRKKDLPSTALRTPDRSILLNREKKRRSGSIEGSNKKARPPNGTPRRRAVDYF